MRKCDATTIPPIVTRGVLIDVAGFKNIEALPSTTRSRSRTCKAPSKGRKMT